MGFAIGEVIPGFNEYRGASLLGGTSQILRLLTTPTMRPAVAAARFGDAIYTGATAPTLRLYRCIQCRKKLRVGQGGAFETIELLKGAGCPECGTKRFRYKGRVGGKSPSPGSTSDAASTPSPVLAPSPPVSPATTAAAEDGPRDGTAPLSGGAIRAARTADLEDIARFEAEIARISFPEDPITSLDVHRKRLAKALERDRDGMFVLETAGRVLGWLWITMNTHFFTQERHANFRSLAVHPDVRGTDTARVLMRYAIDHSDREGAKWITGKVHVANVSMRALYSEMGFHAKHLTMEYRFDRAGAADEGTA
jgi:ribosomal protein S18 acetylase RimI-like enzyme/DNA-directed RNA polymerase subunit RPC12/RpoP